MRAAIGFAAAALLAGCKEAPPPPPVRPVLSVVVAPRAARTFDFSGSIEPRYRVNLGFRVLGRLVSREVEVGDLVKAGQQVAAVDSTALDLAVRTAIADLSSARAQLVNASAAEGRQRILTERNVVSQAQYEGAQQTQASASASERRAAANLGKAIEQRGYARLRSEMDGVVTAVSAQVGQVVTPGQAVVTVARPDVREAALDIPDDIARDLAPGTRFEVALQLDPSIRMAGEVREIGPQADATTRTRRVLVSLPEAKEVFRLGTTVTARLRLPAKPTVDLPRAALLERDGRAFVWVVADGKVAAREVRIAGRNEAEVEVAEGIGPGMQVVVAGVHSLTDGQQVRVPAGTPP